MKLSAKERKALREFTKPRGRRTYRGVHANSIHALQRKGLVNSRHNLTKTGRDELKIPNLFDDILPESVAITAGRAIAAAEVLEAVWLKDLELEHEVDSPPVVEVDKDGSSWVHVRILVPQLDVDMWEDGSHRNHPSNQSEEDS